ncbi:threonine-phosphate decarboxylase CobD [Paludibacterium paludis]|uniref:Putative 8-amino-7-oxononanoate synthase n=1 Tax=Paludibacterium paludis TaxID=1225769 RepID=A0A918NXR1_9NEIS|nr:threonine-phosphate decarboxylase CobD [Paludibacterium paludis]GGY05350.1 threonine-phosphate decarboxylase [Paludibacterium paludis]
MDIVSTPPHHGGDLERAMARYGGEARDWIDLSSGIAPAPYPLPPVPPRVWQRLPDGDQALLDAARRYYDCDTLLATAGSQAAIALLPRLWPSSRVGVLAPSYAEHAWQWLRQGHAIVALSGETDIERHLDTLDVLVLVNPNNPDCRRWPRARLLDWHRRLAARRATLIVDEAFADADNGESLLPCMPRDGLIVLRSVGKFFGLAGVRLGFVAAAPALLQRMEREFGPWSVGGPAQWAATLALGDTEWQTRQRNTLADASRRLARDLSDAGLAPAGCHPLMHWCPAGDARGWHEALAGERIWTRLFGEPAGLRFGPLPATLHDEFARRLARAAKEMTP